MSAWLAADRKNDREPQRGLDRQQHVITTALADNWKDEEIADKNEQEICTSWEEEKEFYFKATY
jgi:hypothetical protein